MVAVDGSASGWQAADQAMAIARRNVASIELHGLFVVDMPAVNSIYLLSSTESGVPYDTLATEAEDLREDMERQGRAVLAEFRRRAQEAGVSARTEMAEGGVGQTICQRAGLVDLLVIGRGDMNTEIPGLPMASAVEAAIRCSVRPVLVAVGAARSFDRVLVAYDGSPRAQDALEAVAREEWLRDAHVMVLSVREPDRVSRETLDGAAAYLEEHGITPRRLLAEQDHPAATILRTARERNADLIAMGGYGHGRFLEVLFGHTVNEVLRGADCPVLVCR